MESVAVCDMKKPVYSLQYNPKQYVLLCVSLPSCPTHSLLSLPSSPRPRLLATGDGDGVVKVWRLSSALTVQGAGEVADLAEVAADTVTVTL